MKRVQQERSRIKRNIVKYIRDFIQNIYVFSVGSLKTPSAPSIYLIVKTLYFFRQLVHRNYVIYLRIIHASMIEYFIWARCWGGHFLIKSVKVLVIPIYISENCSGVFIDPFGPYGLSCYIIIKFY